MRPSLWECATPIRRRRRRRDAVSLHQFVILYPARRVPTENSNVRLDSPSVFTEWFRNGHVAVVVVAVVAVVVGVVFGHFVRL